MDPELPHPRSTSSRSLPPHAEEPRPPRCVATLSPVVSALAYSHGSPYRSGGAPSPAKLGGSEPSRPARGARPRAIPSSPPHLMFCGTSVSKSPVPRPRTRQSRPPHLDICGASSLSRAITDGGRVSVSAPPAAGSPTAGARPTSRLTGRFHPSTFSNTELVRDVSVFQPKGACAPVALPLLV